MENLNTKKADYIAGIIGIIALIGFIAVAYTVFGGNAAGLDYIRLPFYDLRSPGLNSLIEILTYLGSWEVITITCLLLLAFEKYRFSFGIPVSAVALASVGVNKLLKIIFTRSRPDDITHLVEEGGFSFPSGHSVSSMAVYAILIYLVQTNIEDRKKANLLTILLVLVALFVGPTRIYLGVHFPSDVLGGWLEGIVIAMAGIIVLRAIHRKRSQN